MDIPQCEQIAKFDITYQGMLYPMETDHMGHGNVRFYSRVFNESAFSAFTLVGITPMYIRENNRGLAAVRENYNYRREILPGDLIQIRSCFIGFKPKSLHLWSVMMDVCTSEICATHDQICVSLDTVRRIAVPWTRTIFEKGMSLVQQKPDI